jgi:hypothetical protein
MMRTIFVSVLSAVFFFGCSGVVPIPSKAPVEQELKITYGGFLQGGNEQQKIGGACSLDGTHSVLNCDIYNGLPDWQLTELLISIGWSPYSHEDVRDFRQRVSISPLTTVSVNFRLGIQLPKEWSWLIVGAKAIPAQSTSH